MIWQFMVLLATHWVADFCLQTPWQAANKSKRWDALLRHVMIYTAVMAVPSVAMFGSAGGPYIALNGFLHIGTDAVTSRWSKKYFDPATKAIMCGRIDEVGPLFHNFFVVVGLDQLIHQATLAGTMWLMLAR